ncbi:threonine dehydrogenase-like Zn-dependent dehydrogenase [Caldicoprobacter guelmensis]|uniref:zinc-binding dehydrogenase n=1 Tax=Caldicoprobacter guelmensis TaxID=1170224 RepID=UPI00195A3B45|nr:zinc-binding dehydrogenase [Caldicoprobacter guelmensis]MBM7581619.1 threonine dehydrogenase-like Zn-dependent dehydrogenase [Caldicoprobacter guelmensis]
MKSKAMVLMKFNNPLELKEFEIPVLEEGQVLVKIKAAGVCGSDVHMGRGEDPRTPLPIILGHEGVGIVAEIKGEKFTVDGLPLKEGDFIIWNRGISCNRCFACKILREPSMCQQRKVYGINMSCSIPPYLNGCYSEYIILNRDTDIFKITEDIDPAVIVSASCSGATVAHAFDMIEHNVGDTVVVQGPGPLGIYAVAFAKKLGASKVVVIGGSSSRLNVCKEVGAIVLDRHTTTVEQRREFIMDITGGRGADVVVEAVGSQGVVEEGIKLLRSGGIYLSTGFAQPAGVEHIDFYYDVVRKNIRIQGVWVSDTRHTWQALNLVLENPEIFKKMITHRFKLVEANEALNVMANRQALKAVLEM